METVTKANSKFEVRILYHQAEPVEICAAPNDPKFVLPLINYYDVATMQLDAEREWQPGA